MTDALDWTRRQIDALPPPRAPSFGDRFVRTAEWVNQMGRGVTWEELVEAHNIGRYEAMKRLRVATELGLIERVPADRPNLPSTFVPLRNQHRFWGR